MIVTFCKEGCRSECGSEEDQERECTEKETNIHTTKAVTGTSALEGRAAGENVDKLEMWRLKARDTEWGV